MRIISFQSLPLVKCMIVGTLLVSLSGCNALSRLSEVGRPPEMTKIENPVEKQGYRPISMPMPDPVTAAPQANSLWRPGSRGFFKDQRAARVGDILTVKITIDDEALMENSTEQKRGSDSDSVGVSALGGLEGNLRDILPEAVDPANLIDITSSRNIAGEGSIDRKEEINLTMAAVVVQILPNGNLVIQGQQETRVNFEMRQLLVTGIIRREDISSQNTIASDKIAELRIAYGGKGTISDVQQPRYGRQVLDILMPF